MADVEKERGDVVSTQPIKRALGPIADGISVSGPSADKEVIRGDVANSRGTKTIVDKLEGKGPDALDLEVDKLFKLDSAFDRATKPECSTAATKAHLTPDIAKRTMVSRLHVVMGHISEMMSNMKAAIRDGLPPGVVAFFGACSENLGAFFGGAFQRLRALLRAAFSRDTGETVTLAAYAPSIKSSEPSSAATSSSGVFGQTQERGRQQPVEEPYFKSRKEIMEEFASCLSTLGDAKAKETHKQLVEDAQLECKRKHDLGEVLQKLLQHPELANSETLRNIQLRFLADIIGNDFDAEELLRRALKEMAKNNPALS